MIAVATTCAVVAAEPTRTPVSTFATAGLTPWETRHFVGQTRFRLVEHDGDRVLEAVSDGSASLLYRRLQVDLEATPYLHWRWKVTEALPPHRERTREGDDFAARLMLGFAGRFGFFGRHMFGYVWSSQQPPGAHWKSPLGGAARFLVVASGAPEDEWIHEMRNVVEDYRRVYGKAPGPVRGVGIMTDSDTYQGGLRAAASYADIYFSSSPQPTALKANGDE